MKAVLRKLNQESGFSLAEMLAAVLILLMVSGVVAAGVPCRVLHPIGPDTKEKYILEE